MVKGARVVVAGSGGGLGAAMARAYADDFDVVCLDRNAPDLSRPVGPQVEGLAWNPCDLSICPISSLCGQ